MESLSLPEKYNVRLSSNLIFTVVEKASAGKPSYPCGDWALFKILVALQCTDLQTYTDASRMQCGFMK